MDQLSFATFLAHVTPSPYSVLLPTPSNIDTLGLGLSPNNSNNYSLFIPPPAADLTSRPPSPLPISNTETIIMPGKHVRFNEENIFYSPSATPSPSLSESSLPSSSGPYTPPQLLLPLGPVAIHPLLAYHPSIPPINYDVSRTPNAAYGNAQASPIALDSQHRAEPATNPPINALSLQSDLLPWRCEIRASTCPYVTVEDVLYQLYRFLRIPGTREEYKATPNQYIRDKIAESFRRRCSRVSSAEEYAEEQSKGLKRVDFLMGSTTFMGLSSTKLGPNVWVLNLR